MLRLLAGLSACALTSGCMGNPFEDAKVDPRSPIAAEVAQVARENRAYPTFASIPPMPADVRPARQYGQQAAAIQSAAADLERRTAPDTWTLGNTEAFAAQGRAAVGQEPPPRAEGSTAAFAESQRKRATPPPSPSR